MIDVDVVDFAPQSLVQGFHGGTEVAEGSGRLEAKHGVYSLLLLSLDA